MSSSGLDFMPIVKGWVTRERQQQEGDILLSLYEQSFNQIYTFFTTALTPKMDVLECMIVAQVNSNLKSNLQPQKKIKIVIKTGL